MRPAWLPPLVLIALGSGCAARALPVVPPAPVVVSVLPCPAPSRPPLPPVDGSLPFDAPANVAALLERDDAARAYVRALEAALDCHARQARPASQVAP